MINTVHPQTDIAHYLDPVMKSGEHITVPRNSCVGLLKMRRTLMAMIPGDEQSINALYIVRTEDYEQYQYIIRGNVVSLGDAVAILEGRLPVPSFPTQRRKPRKTTKPLTDLPLFAGQGAA